MTTLRSLLFALLFYGGTAMFVLAAIAASVIGQRYTLLVVRGWVWMHSVNQQLTPRVVDFILYVVIALILIKGIAVGVGFGIIARLSPRRPRWWT